MLTDRAWKLKYTPDDGDLVEVFYIPALHDAARYDRLTGYFDAGALALAALADQDCACAPAGPPPMSAASRIHVLDIIGAVRARRRVSP